MDRPVKRIAVTGGAGQIAYSLLFRIAAGEMLGPDQPVALHILEIPDALPALQGVKMELDDCAFPLLKEIKVGSDPFEIFGDVDIALLVGAKPRGPGMERGDLLLDNGKIFVTQGEALGKSASKDVKTLVVGNPCNTNCLIAMSNASGIDRKNFHAMTRLDENRSKAQLAIKAGVDITAVSNFCIWGNHSATQVPDFVNAKIGGKPAEQVINDRQWLEQDFIQTIQQRGAAIIKARGLSSAASAARAAMDHVRSLYTPTPAGDWFSSGVCSDGNSYGVEEGLIFSFPCRSNGDGSYEIVENLPWDDFLTAKIKATEKELMEERDTVSQMANAAS